MACLCDIKVIGIFVLILLLIFAADSSVSASNDRTTDAATVSGTSALQTGEMSSQATQHGVFTQPGGATEQPDSTAMVTDYTIGSLQSTSTDSEAASTASTTGSSDATHDPGSTADEWTHTSSPAGGTAGLTAEESQTTSSDDEESSVSVLTSMPPTTDPLYNFTVSPKPTTMGVTEQPENANTAGSPGDRTTNMPADITNSMPHDKTTVSGTGYTTETWSEPAGVLPESTAKQAGNIATNIPGNMATVPHDDLAKPPSSSAIPAERQSSLQEAGSSTIKIEYVPGIDSTETPSSDSSIPLGSPPTFTSQQLSSMIANLPGNMTIVLADSPDFPEPLSSSTVSPDPASDVTKRQQAGDNIAMMSSSTSTGSGEFAALPPEPTTSLDPPTASTQAKTLPSDPPESSSTLSSEPPTVKATFQASSTGLMTYVPGNMETSPGVSASDLPHHSTLRPSGSPDANATKISTSPLPMTSTTASSIQHDEVPIFKDKPEKVIRVEVGISEAGTTCRPADNPSSQDCQELGESFIRMAEVFYRRIQGFLSLRLVDKMRKGSVIIPHEVVYDYIAMQPDDRTLSAMEVYQQTLALAVTEGQLGDIFFADCNNCTQSQDKTDFCDFISEDQATCSNPSLELHCVDGYVACRSPCKATPDYCSNHGECSQTDDTTGPPVCKCLETADVWFHGDRCQKSTSKFSVIYGICATLIVLIVIVYIVASYYHCKLKRKRSWNLVTSDDSDYEQDEIDTSLLNSTEVSGLDRESPTLDEEDKYICMEMEHP